MSVSVVAKAAAHAGFLLSLCWVSPLTAQVSRTSSTDKSAEAAASAAVAWEVPGSILRPGQRQLFLDDFILGGVNAVTRVIHQPTKFAGNPVIRADLPTDGSFIEMANAPSWDEKEQVWKAWYCGELLIGDQGEVGAFG